jgi:hypothetical protein
MRSASDSLSRSCWTKARANPLKLGGIAVVIFWIAGLGSCYAEYILRMMPGRRWFVKTVHADVARHCGLAGR